MAKSKKQKVAAKQADQAKDLKQPAAFSAKGKAQAKPKNFKKSLATLWAFMKPYKISIIVSMVFVSIGTVISVLAPTYLAKLTDAAAAVLVGSPLGIDISKELETVMFWGIVLSSFYILSFICSFTQTWILSKSNQKVAKDMRKKISNKINVIPLNYFDTHQYGDTLSRITNDVDTIAQSLSQSLASIFSSTISIVGIPIAMFISCWQLAFGVIASVPISILLIVLLMKFGQKYFVKQQSELGKLNGHIEEVFSGQNIVKAFNGQHKVSEQFDKTNTELFKSAQMSQFLSSSMMPIMDFTNKLTYVFIMALGAYLCSTGVISPGIIISFISYMNMFQQPMMQIGQLMGSLQTASAAAERVGEFLAETEQVDDSHIANKIDPKKVKGAVSFKHVRFGYLPGKIIIKDFSLEVKAGQKIAIVGPTGAGKTTLVNLIMRFYELNSGSISVDGVDTATLKRKDVRRLFSMVLQDTWMFEGSVKENIAYITDASMTQIKKAAKESYIDHFIETLPQGYDTKLDDSTSISVGQRQLFTIARAMVQNAPMLILDEATSSVDTRTETLIQNAMDKISKGCTSFVIAHRLSTIKNADVILVLKDGDIVEHGNHDTLLAKKGFYASLYNSQFSKQQD